MISLVLFFSRLNSVVGGLTSGKTDLPGSDCLNLVSFSSGRNHPKHTVHQKKEKNPTFDAFFFFDECSRDETGTHWIDYYDCIDCDITVIEGQKLVCRDWNTGKRFSFRFPIDIPVIPSAFFKSEKRNILPSLGYEESSWMANFNSPVDLNIEPYLAITCWDKDVITDDDYMGTIKINLLQIKELIDEKKVLPELPSLLSLPVQEWYPLQSERPDEIVAGQIKLKLEFQNLNLEEMLQALMQDSISEIRCSEICKCVSAQTSPHAIDARENRSIFNQMDGAGCLVSLWTKFEDNSDVLSQILKTLKNGIRDNHICQAKFEELDGVTRVWNFLNHSKLSDYAKKNAVALLAVAIYEENIKNVETEEWVLKLLGLFGVKKSSSDKQKFQIHESVAHTMMQKPLLKLFYRLGKLSKENKFLALLGDNGVVNGLIHVIKSDSKDERYTLSKVRALRQVAKTVENRERILRIDKISGYPFLNLITDSTSEITSGYQIQITQQVLKTLSLLLKKGSVAQHIQLSYVEAFESPEKLLRMSKLFAHFNTEIHLNACRTMANMAEMFTFTDFEMGQYIVTPASDLLKTLHSDEIALELSRLMNYFATAGLRFIFYDESTNRPGVEEGGHPSPLSSSASSTHGLKGLNSLTNMESGKIQSIADLRRKSMDPRLMPSPQRRVSITKISAAMANNFRPIANVIDESLQLLQNIAGKKNQVSTSASEDVGFIPLGLYFQLVKNKNMDIVKHVVATFASCMRSAQVNSEGNLVSLASYFVSQGHASYIKDMYRLFVCSTNEEIKFTVMKIFDVLSREPTQVKLLHFKPSIREDIIIALQHSTNLEIIRGSIAIISNMVNMEGSQELYEKHHVMEKLVMILKDLHADCHVDVITKQFTALDPGNSAENPPKNQLPFLQYKFNTSQLLTIDEILKSLEDFLAVNATVVNILREKQAFLPVSNLLFYEMLSNRTDDSSAEGDLWQKIYVRCEKIMGIVADSYISVDMRSRVAFEIFTSEYFYTKFIIKLKKIFVDPIKERNLLNPSEISQLFSPVDLKIFIEFHSLMLVDLQGRLASWDENSQIADIFLSKYDFMKVYKPYVANKASSDLFLKHLQAHRSHPASVFIENQAMENKLTLASLRLDGLVIMPIQRGPRYSLLLNELLKNTPETHPEYKILKQALTKISQVNKEIDAMVTPLDQENLLEIQEKLGRNIVMPHRKFIRSGILRYFATSQEQLLHYHLFNDILILALPAKPTFKILETMSVAEISVKENSTLPNSAVISSQYSNHPYVIQSPQNAPKEKDQLLASLKELIEIPQKTKLQFLRSPSMTDLAQYTNPPIVPAGGPPPPIPQESAFYQKYRISPPLPPSNDKNNNNLSTRSISVRELPTILVHHPRGVTKYAVTPNTRSSQIISALNQKHGLSNLCLFVMDTTDEEYEIEPESRMAELTKKHGSRLKFIVKQHSKQTVSPQEIFNDNK